MDDLKLEKEIGSGGSGTQIYVAMWKSTKVAVKMFQTSMLRDKHEMRAFESEVEISSKLRHPHILQFLGLAHKKPRIGIVMEYCEKGDLAQYIWKSTQGKEKTLTTKNKLRILTEIISAIDFMHERKIIHRDIKTLNVLLTKDCTAKIIDFGISKVVKKENENKMTKMIGTAYYMAPEITLGQSNYTNKVDIFAYAFVLFEVLTETFDYYGDNDPNSMVELKVANDPHFRPHIGDNDFGKKFVWYIKLMKKCWSHDAGDRPTALEVKNVIEENKPNCETIKLVWKTKKGKNGKSKTKKKNKPKKKKKGDNKKDDSSESEKEPDQKKKKSKKTVKKNKTKSSKKKKETKKKNNTKKRKTKKTTTKKKTKTKENGSGSESGTESPISEASSNVSDEF